MLIYFLVLLVPVLFGVAHVNGVRFSYIAWASFFLLLLVFSGLRYEVGSDWSGYLNIFDIDSRLDFGEVFFQHEPGFFIVNFVSNFFGFDIYGVNFISAFVFLFGIFAFARVTANPWFAVSVVMPYLFYVISMSGLRQGAAIGVGFLMFAYAESLSLIEKTLLILLACSFHNSAVVLFLFLVFELRLSLVWKFVLGLAVLSLVYMAMQGTEAYVSYNSRYLEQNVESSGAIFHVLLSAFPAALFLIFQKKISLAGVAKPIVKFGAYMSILSLPMILVSSTGTSRISLYFSFVQMWVYPALIHTFKKSRGVWITLASGVALSVFFGYFLFGKYVYNYIPYKNLLTGQMAWW